MRKTPKWKIGKPGPGTLTVSQTSVNQIWNGYRKITLFPSERMNAHTNLLPPLPGEEEIPLRPNFRSFQIRTRNPAPCPVCACAVVLNAPVCFQELGSCLPFGNVHTHLIQHYKAAWALPPGGSELLAESQLLRIRWKFIRRKLFRCLQKYNIPDKNLAPDSRLTRYIC